MMYFLFVVSIVPDDTKPLLVQYGTQKVQFSVVMLLLSVIKLMQKWCFRNDVRLSASAIILCIDSKSNFLDQIIGDK